MFRNYRALSFLTFFLILGFTLAGTALAQCNDVIFRVTQGDQTLSFSGNEPVELQADQPGNLRIYFRSNGQTPHTLAGEWGNPGQFGFRKVDPMAVRRVIMMDPQKPDGIQRANVRFTAGSSGQTQIGYKITGANKPEVYNRIPKQCLAGVVNVVVQNRRISERPSGSSIQSQRTLQISGQYQTDFGLVVLNQNGDRVSGTVEHKNGRLSGDLRGNVVRGFWAQEPTYLKPDDAGDFEFTFANDGRSFQGVWRYGTEGPWKDKWNGQLVR